MLRVRTSGSLKSPAKVEVQGARPTAPQAPDLLLCRFVSTMPREWCVPNCDMESISAWQNRFGGVVKAMSEGEPHKSEGSRSGVTNSDKLRSNASDAEEHHEPF